MTNDGEDGNGLQYRQTSDSYPVAIYLIRNNLAGEIWSENNYEARGAFWEGTKEK